MSRNDIELTGWYPVSNARMQRRNRVGRVQWSNGHSDFIRMLDGVYVWDSPLSATVIALTP